MNVVLNEYQHYQLRGIGKSYLEKGQEEIQFLFSSTTVKTNTASIQNVANQTNTEKIVWHV